MKGNYPIICYSQRNPIRIKNNRIKQRAAHHHPEIGKPRFVKTVVQVIVETFGMDVCPVAALVHRV
jgi:hypothetical protein